MKLSVILLLLSLATASAAKELPLAFHRQHTRVWCWAACVAMVADYLQRFPVADCQVLSEYEITKGGKGFCCIDEELCTRTGSDQEMAAIFDRIFRLHGRFERRPLSFAEVKGEIDAGRPMMAAFALENDKGHVVVVSGYLPNRRLIVVDPEKGAYCIPYDAMLRKDENFGQWTGTFVFAANRAEKSRCHIVQENIPGSVIGVAPTRDRIVCEDGATGR